MSPSLRLEVQMCAIDLQKLSAGLNRAGKILDASNIETIVWSGKGKHSVKPFNDIFGFSVMTTIWNEISSQVRSEDDTNMPIPRSYLLPPVFHQNSHPLFIYLNSTWAF